MTLTLAISSATEDITVDADATHSIAAALAPMDALLSETSAQTEITSAMIENFMSPIADYGEAVEMAPGTFTTNDNGVALGQSKTSFRGFPRWQLRHQVRGHSLDRHQQRVASLVVFLPFTVSRWH